MPVLASAQSLVKRITYVCDQFGRCHETGWSRTGRWIVLAIVIAAFFMLFALCACITARKRRRMGASPHYGTAWLAPKPGPYPQHQQYPQQYGTQYGQPGPDQGQHGQYYTPPPYSPSGHFSPPSGPPLHQSYEMQPPRNGYSPGPPPGSPPPPSVQSNNPYFPPSNPPPAHTAPDWHGKS